MGFKLKGQHSNDFDLIFTTSAIPYVPQKRKVTLTVPGQEGSYVVEDEYENVIIELDCGVPGDPVDRRKKGRAISEWLRDSIGEYLIFDYEQEIGWVIATNPNDIIAEMLYLTTRDEFTLRIECKPAQEMIYYNDNIIWNEFNAPFKYANIPWDGSPRTFDVLTGYEVKVTNYGNYRARPLIILDGVADIVMIDDFIVENLNGKVYIDTVERVIYDYIGAEIPANINNRSQDHPSGEYPDLWIQPGVNTFSVNGVITTLNIEFDYKNTYI